MKLAALILGIVGGIFGLFGSIFALGVGGISAAIGNNQASQVISLGWIAFLLTIIGIFGGGLAMSRPKAAGALMLISGLGGLVTISFGYILAGPLLVIGGILALVSGRKQLVAVGKDEELPARISWYNRAWGLALIIISTLVAIIIISVTISSGTAPVEEINTTTSNNPSTQSNSESPGSAENTVKELAVGQTFTGETWSYTVYGFRETDTINEKNNEYLIAKATPEEKFFIINFGVKNATNKTQNFSTMISQLKLRAAGGLTFDTSFAETMYLNQPIAEGQISPGLENRGDIVFKVRKDATELKFDISEEPGAIWVLQ